MLMINELINKFNSISNLIFSKRLNEQLSFQERFRFYFLQSYVGKHLLARCVCLILLPIILYMLFFYIHLSVLN